MKTTAAIRLLFSAAVLVLSGCGSTNHLKDYDFSNATLVVDAPLAAPPDVYTDLAFRAHVDEDQPAVLNVLRVGSAIVKEVGAEEARRKLVRAEERVDVSAQIANTAIERTARILRARVVDDLRYADYVLEVIVDKQGIYAVDPITSAIDYGVEGKIRLIHLDTGRTVWKRKFREKEVFARSVGGSAGAIITGIQLADMSEDEMVDALHRLASRMGMTVARRLGDDLN